MYYKYKDILESLPKNKNKNSSLWVKTLIRKISFFVTWICINIRATANIISYLSIFVVVIGSILLSINYEITRILGVVLINFWLVLDCVDGNIARCKKISSQYGSLIDAVGGFFAIAFSYFSVGIAAYNTTSIFNNDCRILLIIFGGIASICDILTRLLHQKKENVILLVEGVKEQKKEIKKYSFAWIRTRIDKELGISGLFMPLLIISCIWKKFDFMIIGYSCFNILVLIFMTITILINAEKREIADEKNKI